MLESKVVKCFIVIAWYMTLLSCSLQNSGSPLMIEKGNRQFAVGISFFGYMCIPRSGIPTVYTNITNYLDWIKGYTNV